jgi:hypothetical protein
MTIINPAQENQIYNCTQSEWYFDNQYIVSFGNGDTSFSKTQINGLPYKITWDNNGQYIINNPSNFSYQITGDFVWNYTASYRDGRFSWSCYSWFSPPLGQQFSGSYYTTETGFTLNCIPSNEIGLVRVFDSNGIQTFTANFKTTDGIVLTSSSNTQIKITDNNIVYEYPIVDRNSVQVINSLGGYEYSFNGNNTTVKIKKDSIHNVILKCGKDCPPSTCIKCRNGDFVCCYGSKGTVIDRIHDPSFQIETC